jgi:HK97 family phage prohead protease
MKRLEPLNTFQPYRERRNQMQEFQTLELSDFQFSVDDERRTITGLVVPWEGVSSPKFGMRLRFAKDSIKAAAAKFVRLFEDHSDKKVRGRAVSMNETETGLEMTFKVDDGPDGDNVLALAKSGVKTGLSIGAQIFPQDIEPDQENPGGFLVKLANLLEVSLVQEPSFANSRVITVMASKEFGEIMEETTTPAVEAPAEPAKVEFSAPEGYVLMPKAAVESYGPAVIVPRTATAKVTEPANYVFDRSGNLQNARHDFGIDMVRALNPNFFDFAAKQRVEEFVTAQFADVQTDDVNELNPNVHLPRYIDQRDYQSPVWNAVYKGNLPNGPGSFDYPKYNSSSGLAAVQSAEGAEPDSGAYTTTEQIVTPETVVGKAKISRQVWDLGGRPNIGDLIWRQMMRGWQEGLEARVIAVLDAASPTALGTFTAGGGTTGQTLASQLRSGIGRLQFIRGGNTFDVAFAQIDLYMGLIDARDADGRPLFAAVGPQNADGTVSPRWQSINVNGTPFIPSWALAATGSVAASSYLIDRLAVDAWSTAPRQIKVTDTEVANVYLGFYGYAAAAINDINGVREISYDPVA